MRLRVAITVALLAAAESTAAATARQDPSRDTAHLPWVGVRLGGLVALASTGGNQPSAGGGSAYALFDARDFLADVSGDLYFGGNARFLALGLGAYYPFLPGNVTPYLGGGLKVGWTRFGGDGVFGLLPFAAAGVVAGREGFVQLRAELTYFVCTSRETVPGNTGPGTRASGPMLPLGIGF
jgi:hypothetical protein